MAAAQAADHVAQGLQLVSGHAHQLRDVVADGIVAAGLPGQGLQPVLESDVRLNGAVVQVAPDALALTRCRLALQLLKQVAALQQRHGFTHDVVEPAQIGCSECRVRPVQAQGAQRLPIIDQRQRQRLRTDGLKCLAGAIAQGFGSRSGHRVEREDGGCRRAFGHADAAKITRQGCQAGTPDGSLGLRQFDGLLRTALPLENAWLGALQADGGGAQGEVCGKLPEQDVHVMMQPLAGVGLRAERFDQFKPQAQIAARACQQGGGGPQRQHDDGHAHRQRRQIIKAARPAGHGQQRAAAGDRKQQCRNRPGKHRERDHRKHGQHTEHRQGAHHQMAGDQQRSRVKPKPRLGGGAR